MYLFSRDCTIIRRTAGTALDQYGNALAGTVHVQTKCELQQIRRDEPEAQGEFSITTWNLYLPIGGTIDTSDVVVIDGATYELVGDPWYANTGTTQVHHVEATVTKAG
jgi:hypothetical protein